MVRCGPLKWKIFAFTAACLAAVSIAGPSAANAATSPGFDDDGPVFHIFWDCQPVVSNCPQNGTVSDVPSPSEDGQALQVSYKSGNNPYEGIYAAHDFPADDAATRYQINYDFYFPNRTPIQALEFPMNNYIQGKRYQWAMQWRQYGSSTNSPQWRIWDGAHWDPIGIDDNNINANTWYTLTIDGDIVGGKVHYMDFIIHGVQHDLSGFTFSPTDPGGDGLQAAMQIDGDSHADPYQVYYDNCHFYWK